MTMIGFDRMTARRLDKALKKMADQCRSPKTFNQAFMVDHRHIGLGELKNEMRRPMQQHEKLAAVISQGALNLKTCRPQSPLELAIDAKARNYEWVESGRGSVKTVKENLVKIRVVVRETSKKYFVVTTYVSACEEQDVLDLPEVDFEIW